MHVAVSRGMLVVFMSVVSLAIAARGAAPDQIGTAHVVAPDQIADESVRRILSQIVTAQQSLGSYSATVVTTVRDRGGSRPDTTAKIAYQTPNRASASVTDGVRDTSVVMDGRFRYSQDSNSVGVFHKAAAKTGAGTIAALFRESHISPSGALDACLTCPASDSAKFVGRIGARDGIFAARRSDQVLDGVPVDVVLIQYGFADNDGGVTIAAGKKDHLLRLATYSHSGFAGVDRSVKEAYRDVKANPVLPADTFKFSAPAGAKEIDDP